ncbi:Hint domain-containing protein [Pyxidicoccus xibeiensis]|uniref:Hint domain-containing protein n=1 Tax=Pyxidicoccus xibeiensis TaxID=2906759 RepID=UPI0020A82766|nr:Hint domain-containing protein [Pyxidicoccus xibeiensis]MCP3137649.1 Hint domain-containing protein [Pyxidicoccus xibeiensis]
MNIRHIPWGQSLLVVMLLGATGASAQVVEGRCASDQLFNNAQANERVEWALRCGKITAQQAFDYRSFFDPSSGTIQPKSLYTYPVFGWEASATANAAVWVAPTDRNAACTVPYSAPHGGGARVVTDCVIGCYTPEQQLRFSTGELAIKEAMQSQRTDVVTLSPDASMDRLSFQTGRVVAYTADVVEAEQTILNIRTRLGGHLRVTTNHPVLDSSGVMKQADEFREGDELIREDGSLDPIVSVEKELYFGKTYNLKPSTYDAVTNIVVAQGFLNGSGRYQDKTVTESNRVLRRQNIPDSVFAP